MTIHITEIQRHKFACGLFWQSLSRPRELKKEAVTLAKKINFDLMVLRKDYMTAQAGFAPSNEVVRRGVYSLAAAISQTLAQEGAVYDGQRQRVRNWLAAFKLPDGKWAYFAARDANFLPNGDFAGTKEEVLERLQSDYALGGWNAVIGDAELEECGFHNFNARRVEELLPRDRQGRIKPQAVWLLNPVVRKIPRKALYAIAASLFLTLGGVLIYQQVMKSREERERERAMEEMRRQLEAAAAQKISKPWASKPLPQAFVKACLENFSHLTPGGWRLDEYTCTPQAAQYSWSRLDSTVNFLLEQVPKATIDLVGERASYSQPLGDLAMEEEVILEKRNLLEPMLSAMQLMNLRAAIAEVRTSSPVLPAPGAPPPPEWKTFSLSLSLWGVPPAEAAELLARPGVRIEKLSYRGSSWTIEGVLYAK